MPSKRVGTEWSREEFSADWWNQVVEEVQVNRASLSVALEGRDSRSRSWNGTEM